MKPAKNLVLAFILVSVIALRTPAGEQQTPGSKPTPPEPATSIYDENTTVSDSNTESTTESAGGILAETSDYLWYEALAALLSVY